MSTEHIGRRSVSFFVLTSVPNFLCRRRARSAAPDRAVRWRAILGAIGYLAFDIAALIVAFSAFGDTPPLGPLSFAYTIGQLGGLIPLALGFGRSALGGSLTLGWRLR